MGFITSIFGGSGKKQAAAIRESSEASAANDRLVAQASVQSMETLSAQRKASEAAKELLDTPQERVDIHLAPEAEAVDRDESTGRRRTTRSKFVTRPTSGVNI